MLCVDVDITSKRRLRNADHNICRRDSRSEDTVDRSVKNNPKKSRGVIKSEPIPAMAAGSTSAGSIRHQARSLLPEDQELFVQLDAWTSEVWLYLFLDKATGILTYRASGNGNHTQRAKKNWTQRSKQTTAN
jgi:hypothetical protein